MLWEICALKLCLSSQHTFNIISTISGYTFDYAAANNRKDEATKLKLNRLLAQKMQTVSDTLKKKLDVQS